MLKGRIDKYEILNYFILFVLFFLTNKLNSYIGIFAFIFGLYLIIKGNEKSNLRLLFFLLPNIRILDVVGVKSLINFLFLVVSFKFIMIANKKQNLNKKMILAAIVILLIEAVHLFVSQNNIYANILYAINIAIDFFICILIISNTYDCHEYSDFSLFLLLGVINSALVYLLANPNIISMIFTSKYRLSAYGNDPNYLSCYLILGISGIVFCSYYKKITFLEIIVMMIGIGIGLLTSSKMCILCLIAIFIIYIFSILIKGNIKKIIYTGIKILPIFLIVYMLFNEQIIYLISKFLERFNESYSVSNLGNFTSGRSEILVSYLDLINKSIFSIFFGRGLSYYSYYQQFGITLVAHNTYFDFLLSWGIIGSIIFLVTMITCTKKYISFKGKNILNYLPLILFLAMLTSLSCMSSDMFWYLLAFVLIPLQKIKSGGKNNENFNNSTNLLS